MGIRYTMSKYLDSNEYGMSERVSNLNGENIMYDHDLSKIIQALTTKGVATGLEVSWGEVSAWYCFVPVSRGDEEFFVIYRLSDTLIVDTTWTKKVYVEISQTPIDDGSENEEDGTWIGSIQTGASYPSGNIIKLASISSGTITDEREWASPVNAVALNNDVDQEVSGVKTFAERPKMVDADYSTPPSEKHFVTLEYINNLDVAVSDASEGVKGIAEILTQAETEALVDDSRILTVLKANSVFGKNAKVLSGSITFQSSAQSDWVIAHWLGKKPKFIMAETRGWDDSRSRWGFLGDNDWVMTQKAYDIDDNVYEDGLFKYSPSSASDEGRWTVSAVDDTNITLTYTESWSYSTRIRQYAMLVVG